MTPLAVPDLPSAIRPQGKRTTGAAADRESAERVRRGRALFQVQKFAEAIAELTAAERQAPLPGTALLTLVQAHARMGDNEQVAALLPRLAAAADDDASFLRPAGRLAMQARDWPIAGLLWSALVGSMPDDREAHLQLARIHLATQHDGAALAQADAVLSLDNGHQEAAGIRIAAALRLGLARTAGLAAVEVLLADPAQTRRLLGDARGCVERLALACASAAAGSTLPPLLGTTMAVFAIGCLGAGFEREVAGDLSGAFFAFAAACELRPGDADAAQGRERLKGSILTSAADALAAAIPDERAAACLLVEDPGFLAAVKSRCEQWLAQGRIASVRHLVSAMAANRRPEAVDLLGLAFDRGLHDEMLAAVEPWLDHDGAAAAFGGLETRIAEALHGAFAAGDRRMAARWLGWSRLLRSPGASDLRERLLDDTAALICDDWQGQAPAGELCRLYLDRRPDDVEIRRAEARLHIVAEDFPGGYVSLRKLSTLAPLDEEALILMARCCVETNRLQAAEDLVQRALEASP